MAMDLLQTALTALASATALFLLVRWMGYKQLSQMNMFDYVTGITIGSIAAEMATELDHPERSLLAMGIYTAISVGIAQASKRSLRLRRWLVGRSAVLYRNHTLYRQELRHAKMDLHEFLAACRDSGYFDLSQLQAVLLEPSGKLSFLPRSEARPMTPSDAHVSPPPASLLYNVVMDGRTMEDALRETGHDSLWLRNELRALGFSSPKEVFLATVDDRGTVQAYGMDS